MELLFKAVADKPPRLGIKYPYAYQALKEYETIIKQCSGHSFSAKLELVNTRINLQLSSEQNGYKVAYKALEFKAVLLQKLLHYTQAKEKIDFVHVYMDANQPLVCKPFNKQQFVSISVIELTGPEYFSRMI